MLRKNMLAEENRILKIRHPILMKMMKNTLIWQAMDNLRLEIFHTWTPKEIQQF